MGESMVEVPRDADKMGDSAGSNPLLQVSVSFGRFENDTLSWEKWSAFSPNKYLEEVEKCATPGSVAQKTAYFEAHYKKIAARKAELQQEQEKQMDHSQVRSVDANSGDLLVCDAGKQMEDNLLASDDLHDGDLTSKTCDGASDLEESKLGGFAQEENNREAISISGLSNSDRDSPEEDVADATACESSRIEEKTELDGKSDCAEEAALEKEEEETSCQRSQNTVELPQSLEKKTPPKTPDTKQRVVKVDRAKESKKTAPINRGRNVSSTKKKPATSTPVKTSQTSTPRLSKPIATSTTPAASRTPFNRASVSSLSRSKNASAFVDKKVAPKSLHMSLSLGSPNSDPALTAPSTRKSLIMERMGDKDIVKRAFRTFQNNFNPSKVASTENRSLQKQVPVNRTEKRIPVTIRKENEGSHKTGGVYARSAKNISSFGLKSDGRDDKLRKKLQETPSTKVVERTRIQPKPREQDEIKNLRQSLNLKPATKLDYNGLQKISKSTLQKTMQDGSRNEYISNRSSGGVKSNHLQTNPCTF